MKVLVLSDTHIPDHAKALPSGVLAAARDADLILHAGDVTSAAVLEELEGYAAVHAALGNNDDDDVRRWGARGEVRVDANGALVAMVHIAGPRKGRERRLRKRFYDADVIVFGHSHIPVHDELEGVRLFNPGSPTWKRRQPAPTFGVLEVSEGQVLTRIVELPWA